MQPATPLTVTIAWQALQPIDFDYNLFIHALDAAGNRVAQWDGQPLAAGEPYPMTAWLVGEIVPETLPAGAGPEPPRRCGRSSSGCTTGRREPLSVGKDDKVVIPVLDAPLQDFVPPASGNEVAP